MLRKRLITVLTFNDGVLFRTKRFTPDYRYTLNFVDAWSVDEIIVLDITRQPTDDRQAFRSVIVDFAGRCFVPLAAGGGIRSIEDVRSYLGLGADKVVVNSGAFLNDGLVGEIARSYGRQCAVVAMDCKLTDKGYEVFSHCGTQATGWMAVDWARHVESIGAGEIMVTSIERDGSLQGYDLELSQQVAEAVSIPVLICGGAGNWSHFEAGFTVGKADAVCTTNIYHFTETSIHSAKNHLMKVGINVRY